MTAYIRKNDYEAVQLDLECIILNTDAFTVIKLNEVGGFCWSLLGEVQSIDSIVQAIRMEYEFVEESVEQDIEAFLSELIEQGLVEHAV
ncbi:PqqD family protein [Paenibacillus sp. GP183]|uniref:PqqD family protein n=1 Tax=Paenibacillus sp. GP183 TaxID=1882751 RepID=UPI0008980EF9|nr:PqqD family protein [Paenibacillus sp. GP183]SEC07873.1 Coenzyme PQQ synthesis protein D (PqqD) [Paenibacillus sp. GP183]